MGLSEALEKLDKLSKRDDSQWSAIESISEAADRLRELGTGGTLK